MSTTIAVSGKGGSGKTTIASMIVRHLVERVGRSILAVDADPNACFGIALGLAAETTVADIRDATLAKSLPGQTENRERAFEYAIQRAVAESRRFDLLEMGRPEGPKCYCAVNNLLRKYLDCASQDYAYVVVDNEAGMEHLSRRTTDAVDDLVIVAEPTAYGAVTAERILKLTGSLPITVRRKHVLWSKVAPGAELPAAAGSLPTVGRVPMDEEVLKLSMRGGNIFELSPDNAALRAVGDMLAASLGIIAQERK
jgi:CO dehydrogenase maturation factor